MTNPSRSPGVTPDFGVVQLLLSVLLIVLWVSIGRILESLIRFVYSVFVLKTLDSMAHHWILTILPSNHLIKIGLGRNYLTTTYTACGGYGV